MAMDISSKKEAPHLDLPSALNKIGEASAVRDLLVMLADLLARDVPQIQRAVLDQDTAVAARLLHSLKGCMPIFCTAPICDLIALAESHAKQGQSDRVQQAYVVLGPAFADLSQEIALELSTPPQH